MYLGFERVASSTDVKTVSGLTIPDNTTGVEVVADTQDVRYTMDGSTDPAAASGMLFKTTDPPKYFTIEDLNNIRFIQGSGGAGALNFHYHAGRDV